jgi:ubiquinone/menaquinone biosynthesis C-methylase UbiE
MLKSEMQYTDCCQRFAESYEVSNLPAMREVERTVLGCDYGGTSWTTSKQAAQIIEMLDLKPGLHLLDIGAGSGWPGLYLADAGGCDVTLLDLPINALKQARERARGDDINDRVSTIAASGCALPFADDSFAVISHSDVLCCLPEKNEMLDECRRIASDGASMLFSVIAIAQDLPETKHHRAVEAGPPFVDAPKAYVDLVADSGWLLKKRINVTAEHRKSLSALVKAFDENEALTETLGHDAINESRKGRQEQIAVLDAGLLVREIFLVTAI